MVAEAEEQREAELRAEEAGGVARQSERALVDSHRLERVLGLQVVAVVLPKQEEAAEEKEPREERRRRLVAEEQARVEGEQGEVGRAAKAKVARRKSL